MTLNATDPSAADLKLAEAELPLLAGYEGLQASADKLPANSKLLPEAVQRLVDLYSAWNKPNEAARWEREMAANIGPVLMP